MHLPGPILEASEQITTPLRNAVQVMRASAAYPATVKNASDIIRHSLRLQDLTKDVDELPELAVTELSQDEIAALRRQPEAGAGSLRTVPNLPKLTAALLRS
jgi:hypothetical protein